MTAEESKPFRVLPRLDEDNRFFWTSGADGKLRFLRCNACGYYIHPPLPQCPQCTSRDIAPSAVSGAGVVHSFTVNHQPWDGSTAPWVIVLIEFPEQEGLRLTSNLVGCHPDEIHIGMKVSVMFDQYDDVFFPLFTPDHAAL